MITEEQLTRIFESHADDWKLPEDEKPQNLPQYKDDPNATAIGLLRSYCPRDKVRTVVQGADHDVIYLIDLKEAYEHLNEEQAHSLAILGVIIDEDNDCLSMFV